MAIAGAIIVAATAFLRTAIFAPPDAGRALPPV
jgi:hypothetical protein